MSKTLELEHHIHLDPRGHVPKRVRVNALKRVPRVDRRHPPKICRYCGGQVILTHQHYVYGRTLSRWPYLYRCARCDARIGIHPYTHFPYGTLANAELRQARMIHKQVFNQLWYDSDPIFRTRQEAYAWLAQALDIHPNRCHWGVFEIPICEQAGAASREKLLEHGRPPNEHPKYNSLMDLSADLEESV